MGIVAKGVLRAGIAVTLACGSNSYSTGPGTNNPGSSNQSGSTPNVSVADYVFQPSVDTVSVSTTVTWTWSGASSHTVTFQDGPTSALQASGTYTRTFGTAGTYPYRCTVHSTSFTSGMIGTIVVR